MSRVFNPRRVGTFVTQDQLEDELAVYTRSSTYLTGQGIQDLAIDAAYVEGDDATFGDLTVNGTTTRINSTIVEMVDEKIELNASRLPIANGGIVVLLPGEGNEASITYEVGDGKWYAGSGGASEPIPRISATPIDQALLKYDTNSQTVVSASAAEVKTIYESNADTNTYTDAEVIAVSMIADKLPLAGGTMSGDIVMGANSITLAGGGLVDGVDISARDLILTSTTNTANAALPKAGGTMTGNIVMGANSITLAGGGLVDGVDVSARDLVLTSTTNTANAALPKAGGTMTGNIDMGANSITLAVGGLVDGVDVSARDLVLTSTTNTANAALPKAGGTMTGDIVMGANSITLVGGGLVDGVDVSARDLVLTSTTNTANAALPKAGGTMTGDIVMGANNITLTTGLVDGVDVSARDLVLTSTTNTANAALPKAGGTMTGDIVMGANNITLTTGLVDGVDVSARDLILTSTTNTANAALPKAGGTMTGAILIPDGTTVVPSVAFSTATSSGIFKAGANGVGITVGGAQILASAAIGSTLFGTTTIPTLVGCGYQVIYANAAAFPPIHANNGLGQLGTLQTITSGKLIRLYSIGLTTVFAMRISFTSTGVFEQINGNFPEFANFGLSTSIVGVNANDTGRFWKYTPDFDGLFYLNPIGGFKNATPYDINGNLIMTRDFDV